MRSFVIRVCIALMLVFSFPLASFSQGQNRTRTPPPSPTNQPSPEPTPPPDAQDIDTVKTDTDLVSVPVVATDQNGNYIPDLQQSEFTVMEDGVKQEIAFFGKISAPFHVVLMLDTSGSTQEKLVLIQQAACAFVDQLQPADRVKVISFDDEVTDRNEFTSNRTVLRAAINGTRSGQGTKIYDAVELALNNVRRIQGRKAIVIFTDGVDWHSDKATYESTLRWLDEEGIIVYPIRYDTRAETERIAREQAEQTGPALPTLDVIRRQPGTTPTTFPSDDPSSGPPQISKPTSGPLGLPLPSEILRRRRESERNRDPNRRDRNGDPSRDRIPSDGSLPPDNTDPRLPSPNDPTSKRGSRNDDGISGMLDLAYMTADGYLKALASKTGGRLLRADTLTSLPDAFSNIAAELRTQYLIGYYPLNKQRDDRYRKIKVTATRKNVIVRSRPGYLATASR